MATMPIHERFVPVEEYLKTVYEPDCDYVDGRIEERNLGEYDHGRLQTLLAVLFTTKESEWGVKAVTDVRTQVSPARFRCPDLSILRSDAPKERILTHPQLIAIEVLSPEDRLGRMQEKIADYLAFGIQNIWILDPESRRAWTADRFGIHSSETGELTVPETLIRVELATLFAELDR